MSFLSTYARYPIEVVRGQGSRLQASDGRWYLDAFTGIGVMALGHGHPAVLAAIHAQVDALLHASNLLRVPAQEDLARALTELYGGRVFLCNSGSEANETALKLARKHTGRVEVLTARGAFHGRTYGALALTGRYQEGFGPMPPGVRQLPAEALAEAISERTAAVFVEPVQGESGCRPLPLEGLRAACEAHGALLVYDEVQCGLGRTGALHASPGPHLRTLAKALGGGLPLGACISEVDPFSPGDHGSTFGGNPVSCAAGLATLQAILGGDLPARCASLGAWLRAGLEGLGLEVTGAGLMLAAHLDQPAAPALARLREAGVVTCSAGPRALRFLPPFTASEGEIDELIAAVGASV